MHKLIKPLLDARPTAHPRGMKAVNALFECVKQAVETNLSETVRLFHMLCVCGVHSFVSTSCTHTIIEHTPSNDNPERGDDAAYQMEFDPTTDSISEELIKVVVTLNDTDPTKLALLSDFVDLEALDALFGPRAAGKPRETNSHVLFMYDACHVKVDSSGQITVHNPESSSDSKQSPGDDV